MCYTLPFLAFGLLFAPVPKLDAAFSLTVASLIPLEILALVLYTKAIKLSLVISRPKKFIPIGFFSAMMIITHFTALGLTQVAYMISIKRTSLLFSVLYGYLLFGEENIRARLAGSAMMLAGVALIALF